MVAHRKNTSAPKAYVPSSWVIVLTAMIVVGAAGWLGWLLLDDDAPSDVATQSSTPAPAATTPSASPSPSATPKPKPSTAKPTTPKPTPKPTPSAAPTAARDAQVAVLNNSGVVGAARVFSGKVTAAGWTLSGIGNWSGSIPANTVYYPAGLQAQADLLAKDVGIARVRPAVAPMRMDRLTIILSGQQ